MQDSLPDRSLQILKVGDRRARSTFIRLPWPLYRNDPMWVPPLLLERRMHLSPKNPYFDHASCCFWVAYRDGRPVGRISAQIDRLHIERYRDATGFWGMLEAEDNVETFQALFNTAEQWLRKRGMTRVRGPFNLSINQECGMLVDGFNTPPSVMMGHSRPYYGHLIEQCGYRKVKDTLSYIINPGSENAKVVNLIAKRTKGRIRTRTLRRSQFKEEMKIVRDIYNDAWSENWGFIPFTKKEFEHLGNDLKLILNDQLVRIAEVDGVPAAFIVVLPNLNEVIHDLDGRLVPLGWLKLLWRLKVKCPKSARIPIMGVLRQYHDSLLGAGLAYRVIGDLKQAVLKYGIKNIDMSWILEDNRGIRNIIENIGGRVYKKYRIYSKNI